MAPDDEPNEIDALLAPLWASTITSTVFDPTTKTALLVLRRLEGDVLEVYVVQFVG